MGKSKRKYNAPKSPALCLGCQKPIKYGDRCPPCNSELRRRTTRKPR